MCHSTGDSRLQLPGTVSVMEKESGNSMTWFSVLYLGAQTAQEITAP